MDWGNVALKLTPLLIDLVHVAEKAFSTPHSGEQKKNFVHQAAKDIITGGEDVTTGGAKETWQTVDKFAPDLIDAIAGFFFGHKDKPKTVKPITLGHPDTGLAYDDFRINK